MPRPALILAAVAGLLAGSLVHAVAQNPSSTTVAAPGAQAVEVVAWLRVRSHPDRDQRAHDAERGTQAEVILLPSTLESALEQPGIQLAAAEVDIGVPGRVRLIAEATVRDAP